MAKIGHLHGRAGARGFADPGVLQSDRLARDGGDQVLAHAVGSPEAEFLRGFAVDIDGAGVGLGQLHRLGHDGFEHRLEIERRIDRLADFAQGLQLADRTASSVVRAWTSSNNRTFSMAITA